MDRRRATDELLVQIQNGQERLIEELSKPQPESKQDLILKYSAYIIPLFVALVTIYNVIKTSELELSHLKDELKTNKVRIESLKEFDNVAKVWHSQINMRLDSNEMSIQDLRTYIDKNINKFEDADVKTNRRIDTMETD